MDNRMRQDLDNWITGHYGEDQFKDDDMDNKRDVKIVIDATTTREDAEKLVEFLHTLINETMGIEAVVSFTIEDKEDEPENSGTM